MDGIKTTSTAVKRGKGRMSGTKAFEARGPVGKMVNFLLLCVIGVFMALPLVLVVGNAFKPLDELFVWPPRLFPQHPTLDNFRNISALMSDSWIPMSKYIFNTVFVTLTSTVLHVLAASMAAYVLEKRDFPLKKFLFRLVVISLMFSSAVTQIPSYLIMAGLHWVDTYWSLVVPPIASAIGLYLMKQFMCNLPNALLESARIDGASELRIFWRIVMPLVRPAWLTLIIFSFQTTWGTTGGRYSFSENLTTLSDALNQILKGGLARAGAGSAVSLIMIIPPVMVFIFTQRNILQTMANSGMKD